MKIKLTSAIVAALLGGTVAANAAVINFTSDSLGAKANGFSPVGHPLVTFTDTVGANLAVGNYLESNNSNALGAFDDFDGSKLRINFGAAMNYLSMDFGNDQTFGATPATHAWLELFNGATSVGLFSVALNLDDLMNQSIVGTAGSFDSAFFWYGTAGGGVATLIEIVDNIEYRQAGNTPDGGNALVLAGLAMLGLVAARRRLA